MFVTLCNLIGPAKILAWAMETCPKWPDVLSLHQTSGPRDYLVEQWLHCMLCNCLPVLLMPCSNSMHQHVFSYYTACVGTLAIIKHYYIMLSPPRHQYIMYCAFISTGTRQLLSMVYGYCIPLREILKHAYIVVMFFLNLKHSTVTIALCVGILIIL